MYTIHIRVKEGNKEMFLEALDGLRKTLDFEFQVARKQRKTEPSSDQKSKEENRMESQGAKLLSAMLTLSVVIE